MGIIWKFMHFLILLYSCLVINWKHFSDILSKTQPNTYNETKNIEGDPIRSEQFKILCIFRAYRSCLVIYLTFQWHPLKNTAKFTHRDIIYRGGANQIGTI